MLAALTNELIVTKQLVQ